MVQTVSGHTIILRPNFIMFLIEGIHFFFHSRISSFVYTLELDFNFRKYVFSSKIRVNYNIGELKENTLDGVHWKPIGK